MAAAGKERVILGCMTFGPDAHNGGRVTTVEEEKRIIDYFKDRGYIELDTARVYQGGRQESFLAEARWKESGFEVATKLYPLTPGMHKPDVIRSNITTSLKELGTDTVDIWYLHAADRSVPFEETLEEVNKLYNEGKFKVLGLSNYTAFEVAEIATVCRERGWVRPRVYQAMYNAITRGIEQELVVACRRYGLDIVVYNPLAGGFFSGKYRDATQPSEGRFSSQNQTGQAYRDRYFHTPYFKALDLLEPIAQKHGLTLLEIALRWATHHSALKTRAKGGNDGVIIGVSSFDQLKSNLDDLEKGPLPEEVVKALDEAWEIVKPAAPNYWHLKLEYTSTF
ncbi:putative aflatoxin b1 aldehyde reductase-like protein [Peziza echinospora]|nr:putative aflatoxin b1 aldehyde reductase-like protein [Peziza echinospora]